MTSKKHAKYGYGTEAPENSPLVVDPVLTTTALLSTNSGSSSATLISSASSDAPRGPGVSLFFDNTGEGPSDADTLTDFMGERERQSQGINKGKGRSHTPVPVRRKSRKRAPVRAPGRKRKEPVVQDDEGSDDEYRKRVEPPPKEMKLHTARLGKLHHLPHCVRPKVGLIRHSAGLKQC